ncbi:alpha/beta fold hydrolase [Phaeobacter gallaeciensis]|uniref:alpha/beta fold hydrolase n=1 Tax=Phaeobacter gallaeciensis TaxID=60890 RepID=UPI000BC0B7D7|nr:alpha/beta hydrolase [Phaeobacter gallaeciensis]ATF19508.1 putative hydrolase or acyltransferase (alpha/beta hydrolase superfamily) [Phaeobacter gallaeciensis]ATF23617.1 putative hydrolase or acyltransferase (alpha/beta hydrolase superfamily) [Phaeobacter gallaeciensis]
MSLTSGPLSVFTTSDGLQLAYDDPNQSASGARPPLLCLAGLTRDGQDFRYLRPHIHGHRMITLDARGRGRSQYAEDIHSYSVPREAQDVIEMLDHLDIDRVTLLGTSRGGLVAMALAALHKHRLAGVILNDVGPEIPADGIARIMAYVGHRPAAKTHEQAASVLAAHMAPAFPDVPMTRWREEVEVFYTQTQDGLALRYDARLRDALLAQAATGPTPDLWPLFHSLSGVPSGLIRGANSDILSADTYQKMQLRLPELLAVEVPDRGHVPFLDEPRSLALIHRILEIAQ